MEELAEVPGLEDLAREPDGGDEAVVEPAHRRDAGRGDRPLDDERLLRVAAKRLLAQHVLARARRFDRRFGVQGVGPEVGQDADVAGDQLAPVGRDAADLEALREGLEPRAVAPGDCDQPGPQGDPLERRDPPDRQGVGAPHEPLPEHRDADVHGPTLRQGTE